MTYVTCPIKRYHPAVVAQKAATVAIMSDGRFTLGLGAGENLNEHVTGGGWPPVNTRHRMLREALEIIKSCSRWLRQLPGRVLRGRLRQAMGSAAEDPAHRGRRFRWSIVPAGRRIRGRHVAVEPKADLIQQFEAAGGKGKPKVGEIPVSFDRTSRPPSIAPTRSSVGLAGAGRSTPNCRGTRGVRCRLKSVTKEAVAESIPCGAECRGVRASRTGIPRRRVQSRRPGANRRRDGARVHRLGRNRALAGSTKGLLKKLVRFLRASERDVDQPPAASLGCTDSPPRSPFVANVNHDRRTRVELAPLTR